MDESFTGSLASFGSLGSTTDLNEVGGTNSDSRLRHAFQDQILRSLMLNYGLLEDVEARPSSAIDLGGTVTLRDMRRIGALGNVADDAQTTLLGSTLYEYSELASPRRAAEVRWAPSQMPPGSPPASPLAGTTEELAAIRLGLDRILAGEVSLLGSTIGSRESGPLGDIVQRPRRSANASNATLASSLSADALEGSLVEVESPTAHLLEEGNLSLLEEEVLRMIRTGGGFSEIANASQRFDTNRPSARVGLGESWPQTQELGSSMASSRLEATADVLENTESVSELLVGLGGATSRSESMEETFGSMLQRLAGFEVSGLDDSLARGVRRVLQMGSVLAGARLAEDEISALPKVRFEQAEEQQCAICLDNFRPGELLTELPCRHFFHVGCVASWFERSTRCPLCRSGIHAQASSQERGTQLSTGEVSGNSMSDATI